MGDNTKSGFDIFEHTADIGLDIFGLELSDVFEYAGRGMFAIIFHNSPPEIEPKGEYKIKLQARDLEQLMVDWLDELLYIFSIEHIVISDYEISIDPKTFSLEAKVDGALVEDDELKGIREIKAVTYHMLSVKKTERWEAKVLFDI
jgi:SHS2 domain-containing protein